MQRVHRSKKAVGYRYENEERHLYYFDVFTINRDVKNPVLTRELVDAWVEKRPFEAEKSRQHRVTVIREFARFLAANGQEAYILPSQKGHAASSYIPYIFTQEDIAKLFHAADQMQRRAVSPYIHLVMPVLIRMLYGCGLRISEALALRCADVDLDNSHITVLHSKNNGSRIVPMSESLRKACADYKKTIPLPMDPNSPFFPNREGHNIHARTIYAHFRCLLWQAGISHGGRGSGPRLHDLRHTFAVHSMRKLIRNGRDFYVISPILSAYLGHKSLFATQGYLRLTSEVYPDIVKSFEACFGGAVPGRCHDDD